MPTSNLGHIDDETPRGSEAKVHYVQADDPTRCQGINKKGEQCYYAQVPGSKFCIMHGGGAVIKKQKEESIKMYQLGKWQAKVEKFQNHEEVKSLRSEVGILRMMLEQRLSAIQDETDLLMASAGISELVLKIERVVTSCHKLDQSLAQLLDKKAAIQFASEIVEIITDALQEIPQERRDEILDNIAGKLTKAMQRITVQDEIS